MTKKSGTEVIASRLTRGEKRLVEALAARRETLVSHLIRDLVLREVREEMGPRALDQNPRDHEAECR